MKKLLLILLYFPIIGFAQETGCIHGDCENGQGTYVDDYGETYIGQWKNGKKHGKGTLTYRYNSGDEKKGYWENGDYIGEIKKPTTECVTLGCFSGNCENG